MKRNFGTVNNGDTEPKRLTRYSRLKAGLNNDGRKQEEDAVMESKATELAKGSKKEHKPRSNEVLAVNRTSSQDKKIQESKGSVKEEEDDGRESTCQQQTILLSLPIEIRRKIWKLVVLRHEESPVPRRCNRPLYGLRYRYGQIPQFWSAMTLKNVDTDIADSRRREDWRGNFLRFEEVMPVKNYNFFSLVMVSKVTASEVVEAFFEDTQWIFENRLNLHLFLDAIADQGRYVRSISLCLFKSQAPYSDEVKEKYNSWKLGNSSSGPSLTVTIDRLQESCPNLEYLELRLRWNTRKYPAEDNKHMRNKHYTEWPWVRALTELPLEKGFTFCSPRGQYRDELLLPCAGQNDEAGEEDPYEIVTELKDIEEYVNKQIVERLKVPRF